MNWQRLTPVLLVPALAGLFYTFQRMDSSIVEGAQAPLSLPRYTVDGAELTRFNVDGSASLYGQADSIEYFDDQSGRARNLRVDLLAGGAKNWNLTAPAANLPAHQHRFMLEGPVLATSRWPDNGATLTVHTDHLWVDPDQHEIDTDAAVDLHSPQRNGSAVGMRSDWIEQSLQLQHKVRMIYEAAR